jgi:hypothetical protein
MLAFLLELLLELGVEAVLQIFFSEGISAYKTSFQRNNRDPVEASFAYLLLGGCLSFVLALLVPEPILPPSPIPGLSLLLVPLALGMTMHYWGRFRRSRGHATSNLATFYGGAAFAFGVALVRFYFVR